MDIKEFKALAKNYNLIPVYETITADLLTPVLAYIKIREKNVPSFLLESVEGSETMARYSFIGKSPEKLIFNKNEKITEKFNNNENLFRKSIFDHLRDELKIYKHPQLSNLPNFTGGIVGYIGYENISLIENSVKLNNNSLNNPDSILGIYKTILAFDHFKHQIILIKNVLIDEKDKPEEKFDSAVEELKSLKLELQKTAKQLTNFKLLDEVEENFNPEEFHNVISKSKKNIKEGDIFQIVLSKRFSAKYQGDLLNVYRALRIINPSPYMYFLEFENNFTIIGTSPEDLLKVQNKKAQVLPIAGTRKRGKDSEEDRHLEENLLNDPKEIAEHTMLVDLGRNDLGRVCKYGTVKVTEQMKIQKYSHVMHIVSKVEGELSDEKDSIDAFQSCFPAGTVTGAPKIKAMQLIDEYENEARNVYAGAVGYLDFSGNLDMCIAIRTLFAKNNKIYWQAGAGIVADSKPELESKEIKNKSAVMVNALKYAEEINENSCN